MAIILANPVVVTNTATTVQITKIDNNIEHEYLQIEYIILLDDGTPYQRSTVKIEGYDAVKALYAETDVVMGTGKTFEEASTAILYAKVLAQLGT